MEEHREDCACTHCICTVNPEDRPDYFNRVQSNAPWNRYPEKKTLPFWFIPAVILMAIFIASICNAQEIDLDKISMIESSGCKQLINKDKTSYGCHQITQIALDEYNQFNKSDYILEDLLNKQVSTKIANWFINKRIPQMIKHYGKPDTINNRIIAYNAGINYVRTGEEIPRITKRYIEKYNALR